MFGIALTWVQNHALGLLELYELLSLSRTLWKASLPSSVLTASLNLMSSEKVLRVYSNPTVHVPDKMLNYAGPSETHKSHFLNDVS